jgi:hypothetical protein
MGLDMYLTAKKFVSDFDFKPEQSKLNGEIKQALGIDSEEYGYINIELEVAYWRKANQIHAWFVDNVQEGVDNCGSYYVSRDNLTTLLELCKKVVETNDAKLLEPKSGFFFGSTDVDDWYFDQVRETIGTLSKILNDDRLSDCSFSYHSSW